MAAQRLPERNDTAGFTLVEILAVLAILGILMSVGLMVFGGQRDRAAEAKTRANMGTIELLIAGFEARFGDYPPDRLEECRPPVKKTNVLNEGIEACIAALHSKEFASGQSVGDADLMNSDEDESTTDFSRSGSRRLLEIMDGWDNPIAYFHNRGYARSQEYQLGIDNVAVDQPIQTVEASLNPTTGVYGNADTYQLVSAGSDGIFGTDDDVTNWK